jgi:hypothetical protein
MQFLRLLARWLRPVVSVTAFLAAACQSAAVQVEPGPSRPIATVGNFVAGNTP